MRLSPDDVVAARYAKIKALRDGATTEGERAAAQAALDRHVEAHGRPPARPAASARGVPHFRPLGRWAVDSEGPLNPPVSTLWRARTPRGEHVLLATSKMRKAHRCASCHAEIRSGEIAWRPIAYNGNFRMHRICLDCLEWPGSEYPSRAADALQEAPDAE